MAAMSSVLVEYVHFTAAAENQRHLLDTPIRKKVVSRIYRGCG